MKNERMKKRILHSMEKCIIFKKTNGCYLSLFAYRNGNIDEPKIIGIMDLTFQVNHLNSWRFLLKPWNYALFSWR